MTAADYDAALIHAREKATAAVQERATKRAAEILSTDPSTLSYAAEGLLRTIAEEPTNAIGWDLLMWLETQCSDCCSSMDVLIGRVLATVREILTVGGNTETFLEGFAEEDEEEVREAIEILMGWVPVFRKGSVPDAFWAS